MLLNPQSKAPFEFWVRVNFIQGCFMILSFEGNGKDKQFWELVAQLQLASLKKKKNSCEINFQNSKRIVCYTFTWGNLGESYVMSHKLTEHGHEMSVERLDLALISTRDESANNTRIRQRTAAHRSGPWQIEAVVVSSRKVAFIRRGRFAQPRRG